MSKADTDQGLGPGSERSREAILKAQRELDARAKAKGATPEITPSPEPAALEKIEKKPVDKSAATEPGVGKVERQDDPLDDLLGGFGPSRPDLPRILPKADTTPPPEPLRKELTPTAPGKRQRKRNTALALVTFVIVAGVGVTLVAKMSGSNTTAAPTTTTPTTTQTAVTTATATATQSPTEVVTPITTMAVDALPTVKTATPAVPSTARSVHSATTSTAATPATTTTPRPTGSAPPGMNLLPDDPHR